MQDGSQQIAIGDFNINGNSDYLHNFEKAQIFEPGEKIAVGLSDNSLQLFSDTNTAGDIAIFGFELPNPENSNQNLQPDSNNPTYDITDNDSVFSNYNLIDYDVIQNPEISGITDAPSSHLVVYANGKSDGKPAILFKSNPLLPGAVPATVPFDIIGNDVTKMKGFFSTYAGAYVDSLSPDDYGNIYVYLQNLQGNQEMISLSNTNGQYLGNNIYPSEVLDFTYTYTQDQDETNDYIIMVFLVKMVNQLDQSEAENNQLVFLAYDRKNLSAVTSATYIKSFDDEFNPTCLSSYQTGPSTPDIFVGGTTKEGGYEVQSISPGYTPSTNDLSPTFTSEIISDSKGQLEKFHIGKINDSAPDDSEFWGVVNYGSVKMLTNSQCTSGKWTTPVPLLPIMNYNYVGNRATGTSSIFVCPDTTNAVPTALSFSDISDNSLVHLWTDVKTKQIKSMPVKVPNTGVRKYGATATYLTFQNQAGTSGTFPVSLKLSASQTTFAEVNGQFMQLGSDPVTVETNAIGKLTIIRETAVLASESYYLNIDGQSETLEVDTRANANTYLNTRKTGNKSVDDNNAGLSTAATAQGSPATALNIMSANKGVPTSNGTFTAIAFGSDRSVSYYSSQQDLNSRKTSGSSPAVEGFLDDLYDDFVSAIDDLENDISKFCTAAENFLDKVESIAVGAEQMVVTFAEKTATIIFDGLEDVWDAIKFIVKSIANVIEDVFSFLGAFFELLETIPETTRIISKVLSSSLDQLSADLGSQDLQKGFADFIGTVKTGGITNPNASTGANSQEAHNSYSNNSAISYIITHIENAFSGNDGEEWFTIGSDAISFASDAVKTLEGVMGGIYNIVTNLDQIDAQFENMATELKKDIDNLEADLAKFISDLFDTLTNGLQTLIDQLNDTTEIPIISEVFDFLVGEDFSFVNMVSLVLAVPATVLYGIVSAVENGNFSPPFGDLKSTDFDNYQELMQKLYAGGAETAPTTLLVVPASTQKSTTTSVQANLDTSFLAESRGGSTTVADFATGFGFVGLANDFLAYFLFAMDKLAPDHKKTNLEYTFNASSLILTCINSGFSISQAEDKSVDGFVSAMNILNGMVSFISPEEESDQEIVSGIQGFLSVICLMGFIISKDAKEDALTIIHPTIDYIADFALDKKAFEISLIVELIALSITFVELIDD